MFARRIFRSLVKNHFYSLSVCKYKRIVYNDILLGEPISQSTEPTSQTTEATFQPIITQCQPDAPIGKLNSVQYVEYCDSDAIFYLLLIPQKGIAELLELFYGVFWLPSVQMWLQRVGTVKEVSLHFVIFVCTNWLTQQ
jgi:hypothetical protein